MHVHRMIGRISIAAACCAIIVAAPPAQAQPRVAVYILQYASSDGNDARHAFVTRTIEDRLSLLRAEIAGRTGKAAYLRNMTVKARPGEAVGSDAALLQRWKSWRALAVMWGRVQPITQAGKQALVATSSIYIGELGRPPNDKFEILKINLLAQNHPQIKDTHSLVAGYALLLDARNAGAPPETIAAILATLNNIYARLVPTGYLTPELRQVKASIDQIGRQMRRGP